MKITKFILTFMILQAFAVLIAWLSGFNFDQRNSQVALIAFFSIYIGSFVAFLVSQFTEK